MKKFLISTALGTMLLVGGVAMAQPEAPPMHGAMRGPMMADTNKDGKLTKAEVTAASEQMFAKLDTNGDGKITKEERDAMKQKRFDDRFARLDKDGNGQVSKAEFQANRDARKAKVAEWRSKKAGPDGAKAGGMGGPGGRMGGGRMGGGMRGVDADKDGTITRAEFLARPMAMFDRADTNKDGTVTGEEMKAAHPGRGGHGGHGTGHGTPPTPPLS